MEFGKPQTLGADTQAKGVFRLVWTSRPQEVKVFCPQS